MDVPDDTIAADAWARIVDRLGDLVIAEPQTTRTPNGRVLVGFRLVPEVIARVRAAVDEECRDPWEQDADWWKTA